MIKPIKNKVILRYKAIKIDNANIVKGLYIDTRWREGEFALESAIIEHDCKELGLLKGQEVLVSYIVQWDNKFTDTKNNGEKISGIRKRNAHFIQKEDNDDEIRWANIDQIYGKVINGNITPVKDWVFCEVPPNSKEVVLKSGILLMGSKQETDKKAYITNVVSISCNKGNSNNVNVGDKIACLPNSDILFKYNDKEYIRVPYDRILGVYLK